VSPLNWTNYTQNIPILPKIFHIIHTKVIIIMKGHFYINVIETTRKGVEKNYWSITEKD